MRIKKYQDFEIWQYGHILIKEIYQLLLKDRIHRDFALCDQIRRASISITANFVEGFERDNNNEFIRFLLISKSSANEVLDLLYSACSVGYLTEKEFYYFDKRLTELIKQIAGFIKYLKIQRAHGHFTQHKLALHSSNQLIS